MFALMPTLVLLALLIEAVIGYPSFLARRAGHPVMWIGRLISFLDGALNHDRMTSASRKTAGAAALIIVIGIAFAVAFALELALVRLPFGIFLCALAASSLFAQRSLHDHVARVATALDRDGLAAGRKAVAHIVGRDTEILDEAGVVRAAIESLAENFSDAVVAPALWLGIGGLAFGAIYKAVNTADSMIGHRTVRHEAFGFAAARLDDLVNLPASRLSALLIIAAAATTGGTAALRAWRAVLRDAPHHRSPNAGWPEAAIAGALDLALAGPRSYGGVEVADAFMGRGRRAATAADIRRALMLYRRADGLLILLWAAAALAVGAHRF
jgi:adenosylcobinamide-phosphate synthase